MTIKDFAALCGCSAQTLRYYDAIDLLKPKAVDKWSKYRFYDEEQALSFVKIRNLQKAGFTISEIRELLDKSDSAIYEAFGKKIAEFEQKLEEIRAVQQSYRHDLNTMDKKILEAKEHMLSSMQAFDAEKEFGIDEAEFTKVKERIANMFDQDDSECASADSDTESNDESAEATDFLNNADYKIIYEKHGWEKASEFTDELRTTFKRIDDLAFVFKLNDAKTASGVDFGLGFACTMFGIMMQGSMPKNTNITVTDSDDGGNHFYLLKYNKR